MGRDSHNYSRIHKRLHGVSKLIAGMLRDADEPGKPMSKREQADLSHILAVINQILLDDRDEAEDEKERIRQELQNALSQSAHRGMPCRNSDQYLNAQCEFFDLDASRIQCAIGCDMYFCSLNCSYATNVKGALPPYGTKYMKGRL